MYKAETSANRDHVAREREKKIFTRVIVEKVMKMVTAEHGLMLSFPGTRPIF